MLSGLKFKTEEFYAVGKSMVEVFWLEINSKWLQITQNLKVRKLFFFDKKKMYQN
jgi:hypothetical protein